MTESEDVRNTQAVRLASEPDVDVVIVGAGIIGSAIAYQIARRSQLRVLVVDKAPGPATGSTGASVAISRCRYTVPEVVRLAYRSQLAYRSWSDFTGLKDPISSYTEMGALWVFDRTVDQLAAESKRLHSNGVAVEILSRKDVLGRWPELDLCIEPIDFEAVDRHQCRQGEFFLYEVEAGIADPAGANADLIAASKREGVDVRFGIGVADVVTDKGRVVGVRLDNGDEVRCGLVVNAAGPWCNQINQMAGAQKRWTLTPTRVQLVLREWGDTDPRLPITFDGSTDGCYRMERSGEQILLVSPEIPSFMEATKNPDDFRTSPDRECVEATLAAFQHRAPGVRHVGTTTGICGLYTINEQDSHPIVGPSEIQGLWLANGFSGHGFKLAPGIGAMVARTITGAEAPYDPDIPDDLFAIDRTPLATSGGVFA